MDFLRRAEQYLRGPGDAQSPAPLVSLTDPQQPPGSLRQLVWDKCSEPGGAAAIYGPGDLRACLAAVCDVLPALGVSTVAPPGLGSVAGDPHMLWGAVTGPAGSSVLLFLDPLAPASWSRAGLEQPLRFLDPDWSWEASSGNQWPASAAQVLEAADEAVPVWEFLSLSHSLPAQRVPVPVPEHVRRALLGAGWVQTLHQLTVEVPVPGDAVQSVHLAGRGAELVLIADIASIEGAPPPAFLAHSDFGHYRYDTAAGVPCLLQIVPADEDPDLLVEAAVELATYAHAVKVQSYP